ncbi:unnamed protein product [Alopecurus aequalis]
MEMDDVYRFQRFLPTREEAVGYFLRCLLTGETLNGAEKLIHHANIYACEPKDLAAQYPPVPTAVSTGDRFFFTTCRRNKNGYAVRVAGAGTWTVQTTKDVNDDKGVKIGEARTVSFKKNKKSTGWVMEEYRSLLPQAVVADGEKVLCRIHLAAHPPAAARQESNAYKIRLQQQAEQVPALQPAEAVTVMASAHAHKRPAPVAAADMSSCKKMRIAAPVPVPAPTSAEEEYEDCPVWFTPTAPVPTLPAASMEAPEADDDSGRLSCSWEELFGEEQQEEQTLPVLDQGMEQLAAPIDQGMDQFVQSLLADDGEPEAQHSEEQTLPVLDQGTEQLAAPIDWDQFEQSLLADYGEPEAQHSEEQPAAPINWSWEDYFSDEENQLVASYLAQLHEVEAEFQKKSCYQYNADLRGQQHSQDFFSFAPVS